MALRGGLPPPTRQGEGHAIGPYRGLKPVWEWHGPPSERDLYRYERNALHKNERVRRVEIGSLGGLPIHWGKQPGGGIQ